MLTAAAKTCKKKVHLVLCKLDVPLIHFAGANGKKKGKKRKDKL